jgi:hypothetical protein
MTLILLLAVLVFGFVVFFGAPYLPTMKRQTEAALDLLDMKPGQTLLELGSGDGRVLRKAAQRGLNGVGYELNPILVLVSYMVTFKYRRQITIKWRNYWRVKLPKADGVYVFLLDKYMLKLDKKLKEVGPSPKKLASFAWKIPGKKIVSEKDGVYLYKY